MKLKLSHRKKITIKKDRKFNQTTSSFNLSLIPTPQEHTAEDLAVQDEYSVLLPSHMTLQKNPETQARNIFRVKQSTLEPFLVMLKKPDEAMSSLGEWKVFLPMAEGWN